SLAVVLGGRELGLLAGCAGLRMMQVHSVALETLGAGGTSPPCLPSLRTLILGELTLPAAEDPHHPPPAPLQPQPHPRPQPPAQPLLAPLFPRLENLLCFHVAGWGLRALQGAQQLRRLVLNCP
ncbi:hypothetical protein Agub_g11133, partial [Astrephomene gubernaculifera]